MLFISYGGGAVATILLFIISELFSPRPGPSLRAAAAAERRNNQVGSSKVAAEIYGVGWAAGRVDGPAVAQQKDVLG